MKILLKTLTILILLPAICFGALTTVANYNEQGGARTVIGGSLDIVSGGDLDIETTGTFKIAGSAVTSSAAELNYLDGSVVGTAVASKALVLGTAKDVNSLTLTSTLKIKESGASPTYFTIIQGGDQTGANYTYTLPVDDGTSGQVLSTDGSGVLSWVANAGTFTGGNITSDCNISNGKYLHGNTSDANTWGLKLYNNDTSAYVNGILFTNGDVPAISIGAATTSFALTSTGLNVTDAGVVTGAAGITNTGTIANTGALNNTGAITQTGGIVSLNDASNYAVKINTGSSTGLTSIGGGSGTVAIDTTSWDITSGGLGSGFTGFTFLTGSAIRASSTTDETLAIQAYDTDAKAYENSILFTNGTVPAIAIGVGTDTLAINTTTWDVTATGVASGLTGLTVAGTTSINAATNAAVTIGGGTGAMNIATDATAQTVNVATGGGAKTTTLGSTNTTSATTIQSGEGDLTLTSTDVITMTSAGAFNIGANAVAQVITIGNETGVSALNLKAGTGNIDIQGVAATTITIGNAAQTGTMKFGESSATMELDLGTGTGAHTIHIGDGGTAAQVITIGSESAASSLVLKAGTGNITMDGVASTTITIGDVAQTGTMKFGESSATGQVDIGTGTGARTVNIGTGGTGAKTITIGDGADTGTTIITAGSGGLSLPAATTTIGDAIGDITTFTGKIAGATPMSFDGETADTAYTILAVANVGSSITVTLPNSTSALVPSTLTTNNVDVADSVWNGTSQIIFEGSTADGNEAIITATNPTSDTIWTLPVAAAGTYSLMSSTLATNAANIANSIWGGTNQLIFEGATADGNETVVTPTDPTADRTITLPDYTGSVPLVVDQSTTQTSQAGAGISDVTDTTIALAAGWLNGGETIRYRLYGTKIGANAAMVVHLYLLDGTVVSLTAGDSDAVDWMAEFICYSTGAATQDCVGTLTTSTNASIFDHAATTKDMSSGGNIKCQIQSQDAGDTVTVESVIVDMWTKD